MQGITARCESVYDSIDIPRAAMLRRNSPCLQSAEYDPTGATRASALPNKNELARSQVLVGQALLPVHACRRDIELDRQECLSYPISSIVSQVWPRAELVSMRRLQGVIARCSARSHAEMDDGSPALEPMVAGTMEQVGGADGCPRRRRFDPRK